MNLNQTINTFEGKPIKNGEVDYRIKDALFSLLSNTKTRDPLRAYVLGQKVAQNETIDFDKSEKEFIKELTKESNLAPIVLGTLLSLMEEVKKE